MWGAVMGLRYRSGPYLASTRSYSLGDGVWFSRSHEWMKLDGGVGTVGITDHAQNELGEIVYVSLPEVDDAVTGGVTDAVAEIESVKSCSPIYSPFSGTVTEVNEEVETNPTVINSSPMDKGWLFKFQVAEDSDEPAVELMDEKEYNNYVEQLDS
eukprot:CAMPEP_0119152460 /NCGR_PEP_ID=MMETSP1310-20130426/47829_1 /TAXON_ID=464262 /ORGANISM="Genus nov. species nov., Strain RCC2339" /LENGTH=154 /DNA_ID=CAMNT_0007144821 /DNA_START=95 /DNA_END=559 /DNA_ORIENTATION=+